MSAYILLMNDEEVKKLRYDDDHHHSPLFLITWGPLVHSNKNYGSPHATNERQELPETKRHATFKKGFNSSNSSESYPMLPY